MPLFLSFQVGYDMAKKAADAVYRKSGLGPNDVQVIELHDCFSANELISYEALGLCPPGGCGMCSVVWCGQVPSVC